MKSNTRKRFKREYLYILLIVILLVALIATILYKGDILSLLDNWGESTTDKIHTSFYSSHSNVELPPEFDIDSLLEVHFIDVGQGDSTLIRFPDDTSMLIDAGSGTKASNAVKESFSGYLSSMELDMLDTVLITHPHSDHVNLIPFILENYQISNVYYNNLYEGQSQVYKNFIDTISTCDSQLFAVGEEGAYYSFYSDEHNYRMDIFAPGCGYSDSNEMSMLCLLQYGDIKVLFTGDAYSSGEAYLIEQLDCDTYNIDIIKVGHHGSNTSTSEDFLDYFSPEYAIISVGEINTYDHPSPFVMNRLFNYGIVTYRTNRHGNIVLYIDGNGNFGFLPEKNVPTENNSSTRNSKRLVAIK